MEQFTTAMILHSSVPPKFSISMEPLVHDTIQTFDEIVEVLDLLGLVLVALQSLVILPKWGRSQRHQCQTLQSFSIFNSHWILSQLPHNLLTVTLMLLLGCDLDLETGDLGVKAPGRPSHLHPFWTDFFGLGYRFLHHK